MLKSGVTGFPLSLIRAMMHADMRTIPYQSELIKHPYLSMPDNLGDNDMAAN